MKIKAGFSVAKRAAEGLESENYTCKTSNKP